MKYLLPFYKIFIILVIQYSLFFLILCNIHYISHTILITFPIAYLKFFPKNIYYFYTYFFLKQYLLFFHTIFNLAVLPFEWNYVQYFETDIILQGITVFYSTIPTIVVCTRLRQLMKFLNNTIV